jgi:hypothetical protein
VTEAEAKRKSEEAEQQRVAAVKAEQERQAKAAAAAEAKRNAEEAERQRQAAVKAEQERQAKAAAAAEAKRNAEEAERQRQAAAKAERERQERAATEAEAKRKAEETERQRLAALRAAGDKRVALVIGNSTYQTVPRLPNPSRDATAVAKMFKDAGFDSVDVQLDVGVSELKQAVRKFQPVADQADIAVVYYAGHGVEISGTNYLIPVDARLAREPDAKDEAIPLERLVSSASGARRLRVVILDVPTMGREPQATKRAATSGLGKVEPTSTDTLIAYAAKTGSTANDGDGQHSPYTTSLLKNSPFPASTSGWRSDGSGKRC